MTHDSRLRKVGGSVMLAIPKPMLESLDLAPNSPVGLSIEAGKLVVDPKKRRRHSLAELLAEGRRSRQRARPDREWVSGKRAGRELI
jgi:antitoxin ChpS